MEHLWTERGTYGRANFCRWDSAVENPNSADGGYVLVGIEFVEARMEVAGQR